MQKITDNDAVRFAEWIYESRKEFIRLNGFWKPTNSIYSSGDKYTTEELYLQYLKENKKRPAIILHSLNQAPEIQDAMKKFKETMDGVMKDAGLDEQVKITNIDPRATETEKGQEN